MKRLLFLLVFCTSKLFSTTAVQVLTLSVVAVEDISITAQNISFHIRENTLNNGLSQTVKSSITIDINELDSPKKLIACLNFPLPNRSSLKIKPLNGPGSPSNFVDISQTQQTVIHNIDRCCHEEVFILYQFDATPETGTVYNHNNVVIYDIIDL